ncbi:SusC/RagA family TonB-linked outer membrane protein [Winogradskyella sp.]|uniref:SusC/RagA family TonB-linked outer membrane protein n=1 Tax=Winogradskyella sp. TaxID=1883156 RepID=UPI002608391C|nr:SusC/RagA family TonB-linked outer membrane protein [Winogradskyella sp.]
MISLQNKSKLLFIALICCTYFTYGMPQNINTTKISISEKNATLQQVFNKISNITQFNITYGNYVANNKKQYEVVYKNTSVAKILNELGVKANFSYQVQENDIIIGKKIAANSTSTNQQQKTITGIVSDENGTPLPGASILEKGTANGAQSGFDGRFAISVSSPNAILVISYIGFTTQEIPLNGKTDFTVTLIEDTAELDEIVLIGYGSRKSRALTTAVSKVNYEKLKDQNVVSFEQALQGQVAGVRISESTGAPGGNVSIRVRGAGTLGATEPLYVIDGVPLDNDLRGATGTAGPNEQPSNPLATINPEDIESINVLKDAASTSIYGSRASNGVVIITTKSGKQGRLKVNYKGSFGLQSVFRKIDLLNAYEYAQLSIDGQNENYINNNPGGDPNRAITDPNGVRGGRGTIAPELFPYAAGIQGLTDTDWQDEIFRVAARNEHNVSVSGGSEHSNYYASGNVLQQEGIVINSEFERYAFRMKYNVNYDNIQFGINLAPSFSEHDIVQTEGPWWQGGVVSASNVYAPVFPVYNPDGTFNYGNNNWGFGHSNQINPVALATLIDDKRQQYRLLGNAFLSLKIIDGLINKVSVGADINNFKRDTFNPSTLEIRGQSGPSEAFGRSRSNFTRNFLLENTLTYDKTLGKHHNLNALLGFSAQKNRTERNFVRVTGFPNDLVTTLNAGTIPESGFSNGSEWSLLSYFSRIQYDYDGKYLFSASMRADGASRFSKNNKWGYFPSASVGWVASKEPFFGEGNVVNFLKLRASYGINGNFDNIGNYDSIALLDADNYVFGEGDGEIVNGLRAVNLPNDNLRWEETISWNAGLDVAFFSDKLELAVDVYNRKSTDFLFRNLPVAAFTGFGSISANVGEIQNKGFEISGTYNGKIGDLEITANVNFAKNENEVIALNSDDSPIIATGGASGANYITEIGSPIGSYFLYVEDGVFANQAEVDAVPHIAGARPGDIRYVDINGDGQIDADDRKVVGSYNPDYTLGGRLSLKYKYFDLSASVTSVQGHEILNLHRRYSYNITGNFNQLAGAVNRWRSESDPGDGQTIRAKSSTGRNTLISTRHVEDASFVKIQNISFGFNLPSQIAEDLSISSARIFANVQNPFLWTNYTGYNPEVNARPNSPTSAGEDYGSYPLARAFTMGINVSF